MSPVVTKGSFNLDIGDSGLNRPGLSGSGFIDSGLDDVSFKNASFGVETLTSSRVDVDHLALPEASTWAKSIIQDSEGARVYNNMQYEFLGCYSGCRFTEFTKSLSKILDVYKSLYNAEVGLSANQKKLQYIRSSEVRVANAGGNSGVVAAAGALWLGATTVAAILAWGFCFFGSNIAHSAMEYTTKLKVKLGERHKRHLAHKVDTGVHKLFHDANIHEVSIDVPLQMVIGLLSKTDPALKPLVQALGSSNAVTSVHQTNAAERGSGTSLKVLRAKVMTMQALVNFFEDPTNENLQLSKRCALVLKDLIVKHN